MLFHKQTTEIKEDSFKEYEVLCGIEEEFFIINNEGTLVEVADDLMEESARILEKNSDLLESLKLKIRSLDAEPSPAQIEYVTLPLPPSSLKEATELGRKLLIDAATRLGVKILAQSLHPIQSDPNPIVGTHVNISVKKKGNLMNPKQLRSVYNYLWNYLPEIIGITANSPIFKGDMTKIACNRYVHSNVLKSNGFAKFKEPDKGPALVSMRYYGRMRYNLRIGHGEDEFSKKVIANSKGARLVDISPRGPSTNIGDDKDEAPSRNRVEVRIIDVQQDLEDLLDISYLLCASALHAMFLQSTGKIFPDPYHQDNIKQAVKNGHKARFIRENGRSEYLQESVERWINETRDYRDYLGIKINALPLPKLEKEFTQKELKIEFKTKKIEKLRRQGKSHAQIRLAKSRIVSDNRGRKYKVSGGASVHGNLKADYQINFQEKDGLVTNLESIKIINNLEVQGLNIPLNEDDKIESTLSEMDYLTRRLFGGFGL
ncbi:MAG: hypothetical protein GF317_20700 [Candidatus Lokiarchaeota archaeon]|nr:hypothetical protein [Candidatus Lokiarchaeota archaeon]MBD3201885.1 hypothetical protein [Candidatus Lokiarchaeota archaeon]